MLGDFLIAGESTPNTVPSTCLLRVSNADITFFASSGVISILDDLKKLLLGSITGVAVSDLLMAEPDKLRALRAVGDVDSWSFLLLSLSLTYVWVALNEVPTDGVKAEADCALLTVFFAVLGCMMVRS
jgi:hypothetical protein